MGVAVTGGGDQDADPVAGGEPDAGVGVHEPPVMEDGNGEVTGGPVQFAEDTTDGGRFGCEGMFDDAVSR